MDPEGEDGRPTNTRQTLCSDEFHVVFLHYLHYFFPKEVKNKFNKGGKDLKLENYRKLRKKLRKIQINESIYCVHGLEELTSLKCPYYPEQSIDLIQSLLKEK